MNKGNQVPDFSTSDPKSFRVQFPNQYGAFNSVFIFVSSRRSSEFMVEIEVRRPMTDGLMAIKINKKWLPISEFYTFVEDLQNRIKATK